MLVVGHALGRGGRAGLAAACGILTANAMYFALSATGLGAILLASTHLFTAIKWLGAIYLVIVGARMVVRPEELIEKPVEAPVQQSFSSAQGSSSIERRSANSFWRGFVTQAANP